MNITFKEFQKSDIPLYYKWADRLHVKKKWFKEGHDPKEAILGKIVNKNGTIPFVIKIDKTPIGYIQYYKISEGDNTFKGEPEGTLGFDIFIGEEEYVDKGYGTKIVGKFIDMIFTIEGTKKVMLETFPDNKRAIRCYEKVGFKFVRSDKDSAGYDISIMEKHK